MLDAYGDALMGEPDGQPDVCVKETPGGDLSGAAGDPPPAKEAGAMDAETGDADGGRRPASTIRGSTNDAASTAASQESAP